MWALCSLHCKSFVLQHDTCISDSTQGNSEGIVQFLTLQVIVGAIMLQMAGSLELDLHKTYANTQHDLDIYFIL